MHSPAASALLFDLGGVLLNVDFGRAMEAWALHSAVSAAELRRAFTFDEQYERHERGEITEQEYFRHVARTLGLTATVAQLERGWNSIFVGEIEETLSLVQATRPKLPCYALSNTNASHMKTWSTLFPALVRSLDGIFASHQIGLRKPERAAFEYVCRSLRLAPGSIVFFDDLEENVEGAIDAGLRGVLVRSPRDVHEALRALGAA